MEKIIINKINKGKYFYSHSLFIPFVELQGEHKINNQKKQQQKKMVQKEQGLDLDVLGMEFSFHYIVGPCCMSVSACFHCAYVFVDKRGCINRYIKKIYKKNKEEKSQKAVHTEFATFLVF